MERYNLQYRCISEQGKTPEANELFFEPGLQQTADLNENAKSLAAQAVKKPLTELLVAEEVFCTPADTPCRHGHLWPECTPKVQTEKLCLDKKEGRLARSCSVGLQVISWQSVETKLMLDTMEIQTAVHSHQSGGRTAMGKASKNWLQGWYLPPALKRGHGKTGKVSETRKTGSLAGGTSFLPI